MPRGRDGAVEACTLRQTAKRVRAWCPASARPILRVGTSHVRRVLVEAAWLYWQVQASEPGLCVRSRLQGTRGIARESATLRSDDDLIDNVTRLLATGHRAEPLRTLKARRPPDTSTSPVT